MRTPYDYTTKGWKRGPDSHATTIPREIIAMSQVPRENFEVQWTVELGEGEINITVELEEREDDD